ncbi:MAG: 8-amino-7-oxononanoate synthase [Deltaproteobacteria bacterium CG11_big_fil_rev_8_21_14_0_20_47_16]|nr:MAG: 8-amino-7-oxononanoate synthase [Deltaproteobacteria bacterium CG11_big_fil_rev_8_21_14_0_20_47_16]
MAKDLFEKCRNFQHPKFLKALGVYPFFQPIEESEGNRVVCNGQELVMACSNNYLGLTHDPRVKEAAAQAAMRFGAGCTGSRLLNGNLALHDELEERLAKFLGKESALVFSTGFLSNLGAISSLFERGDIIYSDADNHASIIAGCKESKATVVRYRHADMDDCRAQLATHPQDAAACIITDGVFSMTGRVVDLPSLVKIKSDHPDVKLYVDDAHGIGVFGQQGRGVCEHFDCMNHVDLVMGTFSKSLASIGGFVAGEKDVLNYMRHIARGLLFSAAIPAASAAAALKALEIIETEPEHRERLWDNVTYARAILEDSGVYIMPSDAPILSIWVGGEGLAMKLVADLKEMGVFATPVAYPAVPYGQALIRTSYMATHTKEDIDCIGHAFKTLAPKHKITRADLPESPECQPPSPTYNMDALMESFA